MKEDFAEDDRELVEKLAFPLNAFFEQVRNLLTKNIDFQNLNMELVTLTVSTVSGVPISQTNFKITLKNRMAGAVCISATNLDVPSNYPVTGPFMSFTQNEKIVTADHISGLQDNQFYKLVFMVIGG